MGSLAEMAVESPSDESRLLIVGTGAMACLFAARLAACGAQITLLGTWAEGIQALQQRGVRLKVPGLVVGGEREKRFPVQATSDPFACRGARMCLVLVKAWQTPRAARQLGVCLAQDGVALSLQNGVGNLETLEAVLGPQRVALGVTTLGATLLGPGLVRQVGEGAISLSPHPRLAELTTWLQKAGFTVEQVADARGLLWGKLVINAAINPLTALLRVTNGELLERSTAHELLQAAAREAAAVANAQGLTLSYPDPVGMAETVARRTAANRSSMLQDILRGAPTEIDAICGAVVRAGEQAGVPTPVNRTLWQLVKATQKPERS
jgi:2-dehydropantoate 2-reductase